MIRNNAHKFRIERLENRLAHAGCQIAELYCTVRRLAGEVQRLREARDVELVEWVE